LPLDNNRRRPTDNSGLICMGSVDAQPFVDSTELRAPIIMRGRE
jgi:hypothetical protein